MVDNVCEWFKSFIELIYDKIINYVDVNKVFFNKFLWLLIKNVFYKFIVYV